MGAQLESYFDKAKEKGGISAQVKLAMITKMSREMAKNAEDNAANVKIFDDALAQI